MHTDYYQSQPQSMMFPQMQSIPLPVFQGPATMGYYHQAPVSWSAAPANGLMLRIRSSSCIQSEWRVPIIRAVWDPLNHSATPFFHSGPAPLFYPFAEINTMNTVDQVQTLEPSEHNYLKEAADERKLKFTY